MVMYYTFTIWPCVRYNHVLPYILKSPWIQNILDLTLPFKNEDMRSTIKTRLETTGAVQINLLYPKQLTVKTLLSHDLKKHFVYNSDLPSKYVEYVQ